jgi:hypothetical protein
MTLIPPTLLFQLSVPCRFRDKIWTAQGAGLDESCALPLLSALGGAKPFAEVRAGWNDNGLSFYVRVSGKRQPPWCRDSRLEDSDGFQIWIDTRDTHNVHRASRFCHRLAFLPTGGGRRLEEPVADQLLINRARENARPVRPGELQVRSEKRVDGYILECVVPASCLTGFEPAEYPRLGFTYAVLDRELGWQTFTAAPELPFDEDPSLWGTLELTK